LLNDLFTAAYSIYLKKINDKKVGSREFCQITSNIHDFSVPISILRFWAYILEPRDRHDTIICLSAVFSQLMGKLGLMYYNSIVSLPLSLLAFILSGEFQTVCFDSKI